MKRLSSIILGLSALAWLSGCCHYCGNRCADWNDGCYNSGCYNDGCYGRGPRGARGRRRDCYRGDASSGNVDCCPTDCCDPCCPSGTGLTPMPAMGMPITSAYDPALNMAGGCQGCASGSLTSGLPVTSGMPFTGSCGTGTCGTTSTFNGVPMDASTGWTIQPTPMTNEPLPAPPANSGSTTGSIVSPSSTAPSPAPFPTPVSSAR